MNKSDRERMFFYGEREAAVYDKTIDLVAPNYSLMHETMLQLASASCPESERVSGQHLVALDIGCGTGAESINLLLQLPNLFLVGIDVCQPMLDEFSQKATEAGVDLQRYRLSPVDVLEPTAGEQIRQLAKTSFATDQFNIILSAFTFHHFERTQKRNVFRLVFDLLQNNGVFLFGDLFNYDGESAWLTNKIKDWELDWIDNNFKKKTDQASTSGNQQEARRLRRLRDDWIRHYLEDNRLDGIVNQMQLLRDAGFCEVSNPFRYWQVGLLWARK